MSIERKINRNKLKKSQQNNKINQSWRTYQIHKYGIGTWCKKYNQSQKITNKASKAEPANAYYI